MSKELEALNIIKFNPDDVDGLQYLQAFKVVETGLQRLESIDNANPSEALKSLENIEADLTGLPKHVTEYDDGFDNYLEDIWYNIDTIKQALIKPQDQEKMLKIINEKNVNIYILENSDNFLQYNCYARLHKDCYMSELKQEEFDFLKENK